MDNLQAGNLVIVKGNITQHCFDPEEVVSFVFYGYYGIPVFESLDRKQKWYMTEEEFEIL